jgi:hypothetical protein
MEKATGVKTIKRTRTTTGVGVTPITVRCSYNFRHCLCNIPMKIPVCQLIILSGSSSIVGDDVLPFVRHRQAARGSMKFSLDATTISPPKLQAEQMVTRSTTIDSKFETLKGHFTLQSSTCFSLSSPQKKPLRESFGIELETCPPTQRKHQPPSP